MKDRQFQLEWRLFPFKQNDIFWFKFKIDRQDAIEKRSKDEEYKKVVTVPEWKKTIMEKKAEDPNR